MKNRIKKRNAWLAWPVGVAAVFGACGVSAESHAQGYMPATEGDASVINENFRNRGQRSDLQIEFNHEFNTDPCPAPSNRRVMKTCTIRITLDWIPTEVYSRFFGDKLFTQAEIAEECDSLDQFIFYWEGVGRWTLDSVHRDDERIPTGKGNPESELFGNEIVNGVRMMVPMDFENGKNDDQPITYTIVLKYIPGNTCDVEPLIVGGHYIHTYTGQWRVAVTPELVIASPEPGGIPALISRSGETSYEWGRSPEAWQKSVFNPELEEDQHRRNLPLPEHVVAGPACCDEDDDHTPLPPQVHLQYVDNSDPNQVTVLGTAQPTDGPLTSVSIMGWTDDGIQIAQYFQAFEEPSWNTETFEVTCRIPNGSNADELHFIATGRSLNAGTTDHGLVVGDLEPQLPRFLDNGIIIDSRLTAPGVLVAQIPYPFIQTPSISGSNQVYVVDQLEQVVDQEQPFSIEDNGDGYTLFYQLAESATRIPNNGVLEVLDHDFVQLFSQSTFEWHTVGVPVLTDADPRALNIFGAEPLDTMDVFQILGSAAGGTFTLGFGEADQSASITTSPGDTVEQITSRMVDAINAMGSTTVGAELYEPDMFRLIGDPITLYVDMVDGGIDVRCFTIPEPNRPGDFNQDGMVNGADLGLFLNAMASPPSDVEPFDLNDDGAIDAADLGLVLANWG